SVSCLSAASLLKSIDRDHFEVTLIGITQQGKWVRLKDDPSLISLKGDQLPIVPTDAPEISLSEIKAEIDIAFPVVHGTFGEDGTLQSILDQAEIVYVGSGEIASRAGFDKGVSRKIFSDAGIPSTKTKILLMADWKIQQSQIESEIKVVFNLPLCVKPSRSGSSQGVAKVKSWEQLSGAINDAFTHDGKVLIEEMISGREVECGVLGSKASAVGEIKILGNHEFYDFEAKYLDDATKLIVPAEIPDESADQIRALAIQAFNLIGAKGLARVDFFLKDDGSLILNEINTMPGFTATSMYPRLWQASGITYQNLITELLRVAQNKS
ncbi:MAG: D-alanine--D-alanine ligase, partial [Actinobacteria bacterium]|nr:D-alanine--D-alanine ligase [Actinomycetota bacterium]